MSFTVQVIDFTEGSADDVESSLYFLTQSDSLDTAHSVARIVINSNLMGQYEDLTLFRSMWPTC